MSVDLIKKTRKNTGLTNYSIAKALRSRGVEITVQGIDSYEKLTARSMRLDVLCGLEALNCEHGVSHSQFWSWITEEFRKKS